MLNKAYVNSFCILPCMKRKCRQNILTRTSVLSSPSGLSAAILSKMSGDISSTLINGGNFVNNNFTLFCVGARRL